MKRDLMTLFGDQLRWFMRLNYKQRFCVLYFCLNFFLIFSVSEDNLLWAFFCCAELWGFSPTAEEACPFE